ncbi:MAG TPA: hypothetical protein VL595_03245 [Pseudonocardia sp.]|nr:hypothetical protein [Pseudonocardia sp.]
MAKILGNPIPTAGEVRIARTRREPAMRFLRWGVYFGLGLGVAGLGVRSLRTAPGSSGERPAFAVRMAEQGETALEELRSKPAVNRITAEAGRVRADLASKVEVAVDEAHDSVEEIYGRSYEWLGGLRRKLTPSRPRR